MSEWKECKLGDVGVVVTGKTPSSKSLLMIGAIEPNVIAVMRPLHDRRNGTTW